MFECVQPSCQTRFALAIVTHGWVLRFRSAAYRTPEPDPAEQTTALHPTPPHATPAHPTPLLPASSPYHTNLWLSV